MLASWSSSSWSWSCPWRGTGKIVTALILSWASTYTPPTYSEYGLDDPCDPGPRRSSWMVAKDCISASMRSLFTWQLLSNTNKGISRAWSVYGAARCVLTVPSTARLFNMNLENVC